MRGFGASPCRWGLRARPVCDFAPAHTYRLRVRGCGRHQGLRTRAQAPARAVSGSVKRFGGKDDGRPQLCSCRRAQDVTSPRRQKSGPLPGAGAARGRGSAEEGRAAQGAYIPRVPRGVSRHSCGGSDERDSRGSVLLRLCGPRESGRDPRSASGLRERGGPPALAARARASSTTCPRPAAARSGLRRGFAATSRRRRRWPAEGLTWSPFPSPWTSPAPLPQASLRPLSTESFTDQTLSYAEFTVSRV